MCVCDTAFETEVKTAILFGNESLQDQYIHDRDSVRLQEYKKYRIQYIYTCCSLLRGAEEDSSRVKERERAAKSNSQSVLGDWSIVF
jgi:hypothetical protein